MSQVKTNPDERMWGKTNITQTDVKYYNVKESPFRVYGLYNYKNEPEFKRLPDSLGQTVNDGVAQLYRNTAGGRVRFSTDSAYVVLRAAMPSICRADHMPMTGMSGFDLYIDNPDDGSSYFFNIYRPPLDCTDGYEGIVKFPDRRKRYITINFPLYNDVTDVWIGLQEDAEVGEGMPYRNVLPVVFYGSSITQGGCASRPGNCYTATVSRRLNLDHINLGFSGSGKAEASIAEYMAELPMSIFVSDYDHNAPNVEHLQNTHRRLYETIRAKNPSLPYVMISKPDFFCHEKNAIERRDVILETFRYAIEHGDENVYFIDGEGFFQGEWQDSCTVDTTHPNDLGFSKMSDVITSALRKILR